MQDVRITSFSKDKQGGSGSGGGSGKTTTTAVRAVERLATERKIWGQTFDGSYDVNGVFTARFADGTVITIDENGIRSNKDLTIHADNDLTFEVGGEMNQKYENGNIDLGKGKLSADRIDVNEIHDNGNGEIVFSSKAYFDQGIDLGGDLTVKNIYSDNITNSGEVRTKDLLVTGNAHFFHLVIDEIEHAGGQTILSAASMTIDDWEQGRSNYTSTQGLDLTGDGTADYAWQTIRIYQICQDEDGQETQNQFKALDQIISYTANVSPDSLLDARSWWTLVVATDHNVRRVIGRKDRLCNMVEVVAKIKKSENGEWEDPSWGEVIPKVGDNCALLGSKNPDRQAAIMMAAYNTIDLNLHAPCFAQYANIDDFSLDGKAVTYFSREKNKIQGDLLVESGKTVDDIVRGIREQLATMKLTIDGFEVDVVDRTTGSVNLLDGTNFHIDETALDKWAVTGTVQTNAPGAMAGYGYLHMAPGSSIAQSVAGKLMGGQWYTISFYANSDGAGITTEFSQTVADIDTKIWEYGEESETKFAPLSAKYEWNDNDSRRKSALNGFYRHWMSFKTLEGLSSEASINFVLRCTGWASISMLKLEEGQFCSGYDYSPKDKEGMFKVSADEIYLRIRDGLKTTGIDIETGVITLDADKVVINGALGVHDQTTDDETAAASDVNGLTMYDIDGRAAVQIKSTSVGQWDDFDPKVYGNISSATGINFEEHSYNFANADNQIGLIPAGSTIVFQNISVWVLSFKKANDGTAYDHHYPAGAGKFLIKIRRSDNDGTGHLVQTLEKAVTVDAVGNVSVKNPNLSYKVDVAGKYSVQLEFRTDIPIGNNNTETSGIINCQYTYHASRTTLLGVDGMYVAQDADRVMHISNEGIYIRQGTFQERGQYRFTEKGLLRGIPSGGKTNNDGTFQPYIGWYGVNNYMPFNEITHANYQYVNIPTRGYSRWACLLNAEDINGDIIITEGHRRSEYSFDDYDDEVWILLPKTGWYDNATGISHTLPPGWRVRIQNCIVGPYRPRIYISTQDLASWGGYDSKQTIWDTNRNGNEYCELYNSDAADEFWYYGGGWWFQRRDTQ